MSETNGSGSNGHEPGANGKAKPRRGKTGSHGQPGASPVNGSIPPAEYQFSKDRQPAPENRSGPAVNLSKVGEIIRRNAAMRVKDRYGERKQADLCKTLGLKDLGDMTVAEAVAAVAEARALEGHEGFWEKTVDRNEGKIAQSVKLERDVAEVTRDEVDRLLEKSGGR